MAVVMVVRHLELEWLMSQFFVDEKMDNEIFDNRLGLIPNNIKLLIDFSKRKYNDFIYIYLFLNIYSLLSSCV
jgi:hypothetical protein